jgi:hypothetical protein
MTLHRGTREKHLKKPTFGMLLDMTLSVGRKERMMRRRKRDASYKRLYSKFKCSRDNNFPTDAGMGPVIWFLRRSSEINEPLQWTSEFNL